MRTLPTGDWSIRLCVLDCINFFLLRSYEVILFLNLFLTIEKFSISMRRVMPASVHKRTSLSLIKTTFNPNDNSADQLTGREILKKFSKKKSKKVSSTDNEWQK